MDAGIDVDDHRLRLACLGCRRGQGVDVGGMVDHHHQVLHLGIERHQASIACGVTTGEVMCRLSMPASPSASASPSLAQHAERAGGDLAAGDVGQLVGLGMRPKVHLVRLGEGRHLRDVAVEHLQIEHQRRRVQRAPEPCWPMRWRWSFSASLMTCPSGCATPGLAGRAAVHARTLHESVVLARAPQRNALRQKAAVDLDGLAGDEAGIVRTQEGRDVGNAVGLAAVGPGLVAELLFVFRPAAMDQRRGDDTGRDADDADAVAAEFGRDISRSG